jgi:TrmH family RNA methyltransferase
MANMGLGRLILVEPAPAIGGVARGFGVGGWHLLDGCRRVDSFDRAVAPFHRVVGTTSARDRPLAGSRVATPRELPELLAADPPGTDVAVVFGPEDNGLTRRELERCHPVVAVPCAPEHPTLNLAQAVLVVAYELRLARLAGGSEPVEPGEMDPGEASPPATAGEVAELLEQADGVLRSIGYDQDHLRERLARDLRRLALRAAVTPRELRVLRRLLNRTRRALTASGRGDG